MNGKSQKYPPTRCICIDVDGTLIQGPLLNTKLVDYAEEKRAAGWDVVLWSARGRDYAQRIAEEYDISHCFTAIIGKPGYIVDDRGWSWIQYTEVVKGFLA